MSVKTSLCSLLYHQVQPISRAYQKKFEHFPYTTWNPSLSCSNPLWRIAFRDSVGLDVRLGSRKGAHEKRFMTPLHCSRLSGGAPDLRGQAIVRDLVPELAELFFKKQSVLATVFFVIDDKSPCNCGGNH